MLEGFFEYQIDQKGRIRIPAKLRQGLSDEIIVYRGADGCLVISSADTFKTLYEEFAKVNSLTPGNKLNALRQIMANSFQIEEDNQGRFSLPLSIRNNKDLGFTKDIIFVGMMDRIELWSKERWEEFNADSSLSYDALLNQLANEDK